MDLQKNIKSGKLRKCCLVESFHLFSFLVKFLCKDMIKILLKLPTRESIFPNNTFEENNCTVNNRYSRLL